MPNSRFVKVILKALDELDIQLSTRRLVRIGKNPRKIKVLGVLSGNLCTLYPRNHRSFDDLCVTLLHEAVNKADDGLPEYMIDETLDRVAFSSCRLRWAAAEKLGTLILKY